MRLKEQQSYRRRVDALIPQIGAVSVLP